MTGEFTVKQTILPEHRLLVTTVGPVDAAPRTLGCKC
jgi:hypothetical protein